jgi:hypothetical protein
VVLLAGGGVEEGGEGAVGGSEADGGGVDTKRGFGRNAAIAVEGWVSGKGSN